MTIIFGTNTVVSDELISKFTQLLPSSMAACNYIFFFIAVYLAFGNASCGKIATQNLSVNPIQPLDLLTS